MFPPPEKREVEIGHFVVLDKKASEHPTTGAAKGFPGDVTRSRFWPSQCLLWSSVLFSAALDAGSETWEYFCRLMEAGALARWEGGGGVRGVMLFFLIWHKETNCREGSGVV